jgi:uncharacterized protein
VSKVTLLRRETNGALLELWEPGDASASRRWRFHWGPSDIFITGHGESFAFDQSIESAWQRFLPLLPALRKELDSLKKPVGEGACALHPVAQRMLQAVQPYAQLFGLFITPMAAVAGSIAQELLAEFSSPEITKVTVNNGGDIAFRLLPAQTLEVAIHGGGNLTIGAQTGLEGVATSGWAGRSFSLGIADSVTVIATTAAMADAAATMIANAVNTQHSAILRLPANSLRDDHDLGVCLVTQAVGELPPAKVQDALNNGLMFAQRCVDHGLIAAAYLRCKQSIATLGPRHFFDPSVRN